MNAPIVFGLPVGDVLFLKDMLADCAAQARREYKRAARRSSEEKAHYIRTWSAWKEESARRILAEIDRQERACRKEMREAGA